MDTKTKELIDTLERRVSKIEEALQLIQDELAEQPAVRCLSEEMVEMGREIRDVQRQVIDLTKVETIDLTRSDRCHEAAQKRLRRHQPYRIVKPTAWQRRPKLKVEGGLA